MGQPKSELSRRLWMSQAAVAVFFPLSAPCQVDLGHIFPRWDTFRLVCKTVNRMVLLPHRHGHPSIKLVSAALFQAKAACVPGEKSLTEGIHCSARRRVSVWYKRDTPDTFEIAESSANSGLGTNDQWKELKISRWFVNACYFTGWRYRQDPALHYLNLGNTCKRLLCVVLVQHVQISHQQLKHVLPMY